MNLLIALEKERRFLINREYTIRLFIQKQSDIISTIPYNEFDLEEVKTRIKEIEVALKAIREFRKHNPNP